MSKFIDAVVAVLDDGDDRTGDVIVERDVEGDIRLHAAGCADEVYMTMTQAAELARVLGVAIPRERVEALHAAVTARLEQLDASRGATYFASERDILTACHSDLSEVAEALRLLLEVDP